MTHPIGMAQLDIGHVISRAFSAIGANFLPFFLLAAAISGGAAVAVDYFISFVLPGLLRDMLQDGYYSSAQGTALGIRLALLFAQMAPSSVVIGAITYGTLVFHNGGRASFGECITTGFRRILPLLGLGVLTSLGFFLYFILLILPALMAATRWSVAAPALVAEPISVSEAFGRSGDLSRNNRWLIFWLLLIVGIISYLVQLAGQSSLGMIYRSLGAGASAYGIWVIYLVMALYTGLSSMITAVTSATLYFELRTIKEGATSDQLTKVFD